MDVSVVELLVRFVVQLDGTDDRGHAHLVVVVLHPAVIASLI